MNVQRLKKKNSIDIARKLSLKCVLVTISLVLAACQSAPDQNTKKVQTKKTVHHVQSPVVKKRVSPDGIQDINWQITQINGHKAKFFNQWPVLSLNSAVKQSQVIQAAMAFLVDILLISVNRNLICRSMQDIQVVMVHWLKRQS